MINIFCFNIQVILYDFVYSRHILREGIKIYTAFQELFLFILLIHEANS